MRYVVLGGTGTLGKALTCKLLQGRQAKVLCVSRCELKQKQMKEDFRDHPGLLFRVGDIRDRRFLDSIFEGNHTVFHVAALKHIDTMEENPEESVKTNILGTMNVADAAIQARVPHVVFSSTDKAVDPINVYGMCKGLSEKLLLRHNETQGVTRFSVYRWGNVLGSRGSAIHGFVNSLQMHKKVLVTHPSMTRFWISLTQAVEFILETYLTDPGTQALIPKMKSARVLSLVQCLAELLHIDDFDIEVTGVRRGEKVHENLRSVHGLEPMDSEQSAKYSNEELTVLLKDALDRMRSGQ